MYRLTPRGIARTLVAAAIVGIAASRDARQLLARDDAAAAYVQVRAPRMANPNARPVGTYATPCEFLACESIREGSVGLAAARAAILFCARSCPGCPGA
jgi:hypothetical protein